MISLSKSPLIISADVTLATAPRLPFAPIPSVFSVWEDGEGAHSNRLCDFLPRVGQQGSRLQSLDLER